MPATTGQLPAVVTIIDLGSAALPLDSSVVFEAVQTSNGTMISVQVPLTAIMTTVQGALPTGGGTGQILNKTNANNYSTQWSSITQFLAIGTGLATSGSATSVVVSFATQVALSVLGVTGNATIEPAAIVGTAAQVLRVNDAGNALGFGAVNLASAAAVTGVLSVPTGGTNTSTLTLNGVVFGNGTSTVGITASGATGSVLVAPLGAAPSFTTAPVLAGKGTFLSNTALSSTATAVLVFGSIASFGMYVGTGVPSVNAGTGSLFLRNDGATATTRMYVNINGTGTWTGVNTVA